jgi:hypothetical protein
MSGGDRIIRWSTALAVLGVAAVAAVASYEHAYDLVRAHSETGGARHTSSAPRGPAPGATTARFPRRESRKPGRESRKPGGKSCHVSSPQGEPQAMIKDRGGDCSTRVVAYSLDVTEHGQVTAHNRLCFTIRWLMKLIRLMLTANSLKYELIALVGDRLS